MSQFASKTNNKSVLTQAEIQTGFSKCGEDGLLLNSNSANSALNYLDTKIENTNQQTQEYVKEADAQIHSDIESILKTLEEMQSKKAEVPIGAIIMTIKHYYTPEHFKTEMGYGVWQRALQGRVAVGFSENAYDPVLFRTHGIEYGEFEHTLTIDEMPKHDHRKSDYDSTTGGDRLDGTMHFGEAGTGNYQGDVTSGFAGGDKPHNNIQPSKTIDVWQRIA